jgi:hypothetical protein
MLPEKERTSKRPAEAVWRIPIPAEAKAFLDAPTV